MKKPPKIFNRIVDKVLAYKPKPKPVKKSQENQNGSTKNKGNKVHLVREAGNNIKVTWCYKRFEEIPLQITTDLQEATCGTCKRVFSAAERTRKVGYGS